MKNQISAIATTNQILSNLQNGVSTKNAIKRIIKKITLLFSVLSLFTTSIHYLANQLDHDFPIGSTGALFVIGVVLIMCTYVAIGQISQLPEKPLGETIYKMYANHINRHAPGQQITHQFTVTVTENKRK
ncbi:MAG: hypothetical protein Q7T91_02110 [Sulfuricurvum sp.]|nr:hypothetical protein [Sulfuricurvum sp.]